MSVTCEHQPAQPRGLIGPLHVTEFYEMANVIADHLHLRWVGENSSDRKTDVIHMRHKAIEQKVGSD